QTLGSAIPASRQLLSDGLFQFDLPSNNGTTHVLDLLSKLPGFKYAEPDFVAHLDATLPNDPSFTSMWGLNNTGQSGGISGMDIRAAQAWDISTGNPNTVVADVDTGADWSHPDLAANIWTNPGEIAGNNIDD